MTPLRATKKKLFRSKLQKKSQNGYASRGRKRNTEVMRKKVREGLCTWTLSVEYVDDST